MFTYFCYNFFENKYNILVTYTYCFFSIPAFLCLILETYFLRDAKLYCPYTWCRVILEYPLFFWRGGTVSISRQPAIPGYQNITFDGTILTLCSAKITCNCTFVTVGSSLIFFLTFDGTILTLCSTNITCNYTFVTFNGSPFFFFSHLMVPSLHYAVPTSHVTVLLSHSMVPLFFLAFDSTILTLRSTNITCDYIFVTFSGSLFFFSYLMIPSSHYAVPTSHVTVLWSHSVVPLFFLTFNGTILTLCSTNITYNG